MYNTTDNSQISFSDQFFGGKDPVPDDHPYIKLEKAIDWTEINRYFKKFYERSGRYSVPIKHMILLLLVKHLENISDEDLIRKLATDIALQKALNLPFLKCQLKYYTVNTKRGQVKKFKGYIDPSNLSLFRNRIGVEGIKFLEEVLYEILKGKKKTYRVVFDTTAAPANIEYPTDISLLEKSRKCLLRLLKKYSLEKPRTYCRKARKTFLTYIKLGRKNRKKTKKVQGQMIRFVRRNLKQVKSLVDRNKLNSREKQILTAIETLLEQQIFLHKKIPRNGEKQGISIPQRIISIFKPHVRPIPRGKIPQKTEFGSKVLLQFHNGILKPLTITNENESDNTMLTPFIKEWKGYSLGADRGFHSKDNLSEAKKSKLRKCFIEPKGKKRLKKTKALKKIRSLRSIIESKIGLSKRKFGLNKILYGRGEFGDEQWIRLGLLTMNLKYNLL